MNNTIGIIGAMDEEIQEYIGEIKDLKKEKWKTFTFYKGKYFGKNIILVKSGVGKVFASMVCQHIIDKYDIKMVIFTGVGGSLNNKLGIGDVIVGKDSVHHDFNALPLGFKRGQISYTNFRFFGAEKKLIDLALKTDLGPHKIISGRILTGDQFFTHKEKIKNRYLKEELNGDCIEMEGAAVAQVCTINKVPHVIIRTVSDNADKKAVMDYNSFKHIVAKNSLKVTAHILKNI